METETAYRARTTQYWENLVLVVVLVSESKLSTKIRDLALRD